MEAKSRPMSVLLHCTLGVRRVGEILAASYVRSLSKQFLHLDVLCQSLIQLFLMSLCLTFTSHRCTLNHKKRIERKFMVLEEIWHFLRASSQHSSVTFAVITTTFSMTEHFSF